MPGVTRQTDFASVPGYVPDPATALKGSKNVFIEKLAAVRVGDQFISHIRADLTDLHSRPTVTKGSANVFVNGVPLARTGDPLSCGHIITKSSDTVFNGS